MRLFLLFILTLLSSLSLPASCRAQSSPLPPLLALADDLEYRGLAAALKQSCRYYDKAPDRIYDVCGQRLSGRELSHAYRQLISRLQEQTTAEILPFLAENFSACQPAPLLVTGYYTPVLDGSLIPTASHRFPLHALPDQEDLRRLRRQEITGSNKLKDHEIAYLTDPVDLFFLQVQGSGILKLPDNSRRLAAYAGSNGRPYTSIGKILIQEGKMTKEEVSLATIHRYLSDHPQQRERILNLNERFIFFRLIAPEAAELAPRGSLGSPLTPGRSVAMDGSHYPPGIMGILTSRRPFFDKEGRLSWQPFGRLVTHQDSGAAIKGRHRLDLYLGSGPQNGQAAGLMKEEGNFVMLIPNLSFQHVHSIIGTGNHITLSPQGEKRSP